MPELKRDDGIVIHWEEQGEGTALLVSPNSNVTTPSNYNALLSDLAADHRVVTWDPRGTGQSRALPLHTNPVTGRRPPKA